MERVPSAWQGRRPCTGRAQPYGAHLSPFFSLVLSCLRTAAGTVESGRLTAAGWLNNKWLAKESTYRITDMETLRHGTPRPRLSRRQLSAAVGGEDGP